MTPKGQSQNVEQLAGLQAVFPTSLKAVMNYTLTLWTL